MSTSNTWNCYSCTCTGVRSLVLKRTCTDCLRLLEDSKSEDLWNSNAKERLKDFWPRPLAHLSKGLHPRFRTEPLPHLVTWTVVEVKVTKVHSVISVFLNLAFFASSHEFTTQKRFIYSKLNLGPKNCYRTISFSRQTQISLHLEIVHALK